MLGVAPGVSAPVFTKTGVFKPVRGTEKNYAISAQTLDSGGSPLGSATVKLFNTQDDTIVATMVSDASGNYSFDVTGRSGSTFYAVMYKAGAPDVAGTTVNTLVGA